MIDPQCYARWRADAAAVPIIDVLASSKDPILSLQHGQTGMKMRPSRQELAEFFGTEDAFTAAEFILRNGKLINAPSGGSIRSNYVNQGQ
jgi:ribosome maturation protein Sdo1